MRIKQLQQNPSLRVKRQVGSEKKVFSKEEQEKLNQKKIYPLDIAVICRNKNIMFSLIARFLLFIFFLFFFSFFLFLQLLFFL